MLYVTKGKAAIQEGGLRCLGPRMKQPDTRCNKLCVKLNRLNQIAGSFKCERCNQIIEVEIVDAK